MEILSRANLNARMQGYGKTCTWKTVLLPWIAIQDGARVTNFVGFLLCFENMLPQLSAILDPRFRLEEPFCLRIQREQSAVQFENTGVRVDFTVPIHFCKMVKIVLPCRLSVFRTGAQFRWRLFSFPKRGVTCGVIDEDYAEGFVCNAHAPKVDMTGPSTC